MLARRAITIELLEQLDYVYTDSFNVAQLEQLDRVLTRLQYKPYRSTGQFQCYVPSFKHYENSHWRQISSDTNACHQCGEADGAWPAVSITGASCALQCEHCKANILKPMIAATTAEDLWRVTSELVAKGGRGMLLTGGSDQSNRVNYTPFLATIDRIKKHFPFFTIACHTGLVTQSEVQDLEQAGVDVAMMDVIGAQDTVTRVYHLKRDVTDFEQSLFFLRQSAMRVVPHIVVGLHFGQLLGEWRALQWIKQHRPDALVLAVIMPHFTADRHLFALPDIFLLAKFFLHVRQQLPDLSVKLGCGRPPGNYGRLLDLWALMCDFEGVAYPAEGLVQLARYLGKDVQFQQRCCSC